MAQQNSGDVRYMTALQAIKISGASGIVEIDEDDFAFLTRKTPWILTDQSRAKRCLEAIIYGAAQYIGLPPAQPCGEYIAGTIAAFVSPVNYWAACHFMENCNWSEDIIAGLDRPVSTKILHALVCRVNSGIADDDVERMHKEYVKSLKHAGVA